MSDYTPTTEVIRHAVAFPRERLGEPRPIKPEAFDRWLWQERGEAWEEGKRAGLRQSDWEHGDTATRYVARNPYRKENE